MLTEGWKAKLLGGVSALAVLLVFEPVREIFVQVASETVLSRLRGPDEMTSELGKSLEALLHREFHGFAGRPDERRKALSEAAARFAQDQNLSPEAVLARQRELLFQWESAEQSLQRGLTLIRENQYEDARSEILSAGRHDPANPAVWSNLGAIDLLLGKVDEGREAYDRALALDPHDPVTRYNFGLFFIRTANPDAAAEQLVQAFASPKVRRDSELRGILLADLRENPLLAEIRQRPEIRRLLQG